MAGRPRKPTAIHALTGAIEHDPGRFRDRMNEPQDDRALGPAPDSWPAEKRVCWDEIARLAHWLRYPDRLAVELAASLLFLMRVVGVGAMQAGQLARLESALGNLGLSPATRSKINMPRQLSASNPFAQCGKRPPRP